jgi:hypothetical protein
MSNATMAFLVVGAVIGVLVLFVTAVTVLVLLALKLH